MLHSIEAESDCMGLSSSASPSATPPQAMGLAAFNGLPDADAVAALLGCCSARRWAERVAAGRPYRSVAAALAASDDAVAGLADEDLRQALAGHPRIGERAVQPAASPAPAAAGEAGVASVAGSHEQAGWSRAEQAGVNRADPELARALAEGNAAYEQRFGHIYLVSATGKSGPEMLEILRRRLASEPDAEWRVVREELAKINALRLRRLLGGGDLA